MDLSEFLTNFNKTDHEALVVAIEKIVIPEVAKLEAKIEDLQNQVEILKMVITASPEALKVVKAIWREHTKKEVDNE